MDVCVVNGGQPAVKKPVVNERNERPEEDRAQAGDYAGQNGKEQETRPPHGPHKQKVERCANGDLPESCLVA